MNERLKQIALDIVKLEQSDSQNESAILDMIQSLTVDELLEIDDFIMTKKLLDS